MLSQCIYAGNEKMKAATGWEPVYTSGEAFMTYANKMRDRKRQDPILR